jgi:hypothetical protein
MEYAVLPAGCTMSVREFLSDRATQTVHVHETSLASTHGHFGKLSEHAMVVQVQKLKCMDLVCTQSIATGRALDALGHEVCGRSLYASRKLKSDRAAKTGPVETRCSNCQWPRKRELSSPENSFGVQSGIVAHCIILFKEYLYLTCKIQVFTGSFFYTHTVALIVHCCLVNSAPRCGIILLDDPMLLL